MATQPVHVAVGDLITASFMNNLIDWVGGGFAAYTPALRALTTNPTLGTGAIQDGRYSQTGKLVVVHVNLQFGTAGIAVGSGIYWITLPVTPATPANTKLIGRGRVRAGGSGAHWYPVDVTLDGSGQQRLVYLGAAVSGALNNTSDSVPGGWVASDEFDITYWYEAA
jgi:hypothetical protein